MSKAAATPAGDAAPDMSHSEDARRFQANLELLAEMGRDFATSLDLDAALCNAVRHITTSVNAEGGALFLLDEDGKRLCCNACIGPTEITGLVIDSDQGIVGRSVQSDCGEIIRDVSEDPDFFSGVDEKTGFKTRSILCAPLSVKGERLGAIELINKRGGDGLFDSDDLHFLEALAASAALAILNARQAEALVEQERLKRELELAREIQSSLLPREEGASAISGVNRPAREVSGDFYDFFNLDDGRICFNLGDVSGKGMNAALLMAKTASLYRCLGKSVLSPGRLLAHINKEICETAHRGMFVTMIGGIYDPKTGIVRIANAGHEPPLLMDGDGDFTAFEAEGPPLGIIPDPPTENGYEEVEIDLAGGSFWVFTDGVTEGYAEGGDELEVEGVKRILRDNMDRPLADRLAAVVEAIHPGEKGLRDDLTLLGIQGGQVVTAQNDQDKAARAIEPLLELRVPARADRLKLIRQAVSSTMRFAGCDGNVANDIVLAVDEACQNIIRHGYGGREDGEIGIALHRAGDEVIIRLQDFAPPVDVEKIRPRDLDDLRPGGLGTHFIREIMDDVEFLTPPSNVGNLLQLKKNIGSNTGGS